MQYLSIPKKRRIYDIAFAPNGRELAAACGDELLRVWDLTTGDVRQWVSIDHTSDGHAIAYLDQDRLVVAGPGIRWWDIPANGWNEITPSSFWHRQLCLSPDGLLMALVDDAESVDWPQQGLFVFDTGEWFEVNRFEDRLMTTGGVAFSPDGKWLATGHMVRVGEKRRYFGYVPGGYAVHEYDYVVHIREVATGKIVQSVDGWQQGIRHLMFSPDGKFLAGTAGPRLRIWDLEGQREVALHKRGSKHFQGLAFTSDGRYLATVSNDETVRVWETNTWQEHTTFTWKIGKLLNIALSPEGLRAAAGSDKGQIVIWDVEE
jgi:WD40 repeat protein